MGPLLFSSTKTHEQREHSTYRPQLRLLNNRTLSLSTTTGPACRWAKGGRGTADYGPQVPLRACDCGFVSGGYNSI